MTADEVAKRLDNRAGYELITYREVGLPVFVIHATALVLEKQERSCVEDFALRALSAGLDTPAQIQGLLGLPRKIVELSLADLVRQEAVRTSTESGRLLLTERGKQAVEHAELTCPSQQTIWFPFDGLLRRPKWYGNAVFLEPHDARELGLPQIRAIPARAPEVDELSAADVSEVVRVAAGARRGERDVLRVLTIERRWRKFLQAIALVYRSLQGDEVQVGFAIDGRLSQEHELAFSRGGGLKRQLLFDGLADKVALGSPAGVLPGRLDRLLQDSEAQREKAARISASRSALDKASLCAVTAQTTQERQEAALAKQRALDDLMHAEEEVQRAPVRPLAVYEHPAILEAALATATRRLLIVSPWIRRAVVNDAFLTRLRAACARGVKVFIGYGLGNADAGEKRWDVEARNRLEELANELQSLTVRRLGDTHAKVLVKDSEFFVITSFNWLSFRGDPSQPFREEWGTIVRESALVNEFYADMVKRFA